MFKIGIVYLMMYITYFVYKITLYRDSHYVTKV